MSALDFGALAPAKKDDEHRLAWPYSGQTFEVELLAEDDGDRPYVTIAGDCPEEVHNVMSDICGSQLDEPVFDLDELPKVVGRFKATLTYWQEDRVDWESGINDPDLGFSITNLTQM